MKPWLSSILLLAAATSAQAAGPLTDVAPGPGCDCSVAAGGVPLALFVVALLGLRRR